MKNKIKEALIDTFLIAGVFGFIFTSIYFITPSDTFIDSTNKLICQKKAFSFTKTTCLGESGVVIITKYK